MKRLDRTTMVALAALYHVTLEADDLPWHAPLQLRAVLWLLYQRSNGNREPYKAFWRTMMGEERGTQPAYARATYARTHWTGIVRSLGGKPEPIAFDASIRSLIKQYADGR